MLDSVASVSPVLFNDPDIAAALILDCEVADAELDEELMESEETRAFSLHRSNDHEAILSSMVTSHSQLQWGPRGDGHGTPVDEIAQIQHARRGCCRRLIQPDILKSYARRRSVWRGASRYRWLFCR